MPRPTCATIDLGALRHNAALVRRLAPGSRVMAVIKADAYGHGAVTVAEALQGLVDGFAVAFLDEALELRRAGIGERLLLLEGFFSRAELTAVAAHRLDTVVCSAEQLATLVAAGGSGSFRVWLKLDSGMHRLGLPSDRFREAIEALDAAPHVAELVLMSHFARADEIDQGPTDMQLALYEEAVQGGAQHRQSIANSAALLARPDTHRDWVRTGLALFGLSPLAWRVPAAEELRPVMCLRSEVIAVQCVPAGGAVGYGGRWTCEAPSRIGLVPIGYADGYPRTATDGTPVLVAGRRAPLVGRVSMDLLTVDLTGLPSAGVGSAVELWGPSLSAVEVAEACGTIPHDLLAGVSRRVPRRQGSARDAVPSVAKAPGSA